MKKYILLSFLISSFYIGIINPVYALTFEGTNNPPNLILQHCVVETNYFVVRIFDKNHTENPALDGVECSFLPVNWLVEYYPDNYWLEFVPIELVLIEASNSCGFSYDEMKAEECFIDEQFFDFTGSETTSILSIGNTSDIMALVGMLFNDLWLILALVIGIPLAFYIIQRIIKIVPADKKEKAYMERKGFTAEKEWETKSKKDIIFTETKDIHGHKQITGGHYKKDK